MRNLGIVALALIFFSVSGVVPAHAGCDTGVSAYNSALSDIETYLKRYTNCLTYSRGNDDCSSEFRRLRSAQSDLESAVSEYQAYCRQ
jgi:hypothetical protein